MNDQQLPEYTAQDPEFSYAPSVRLSDELLQSVETAHRGKAESFGATPYDRYYTLKSQQEVLSGLQELVTNIPEDTPLVIASYVQDTFNTRFWNRLKANDENFTTSLLYGQPEKVDGRLFDMIERGSIGEASPAELILIRDQLGVRSLELACLTHPYGEKIEQLDEMRETIRSAIEIFDGEYDPEPTPRYGVKEVVYDENGLAMGMLMTRKRDVGSLSDGTIIRERSSFVLRIDTESDLSQLIGADMVAKLVEIQALPKAEQQIALGEFNAIISDFLKFDAFSQAIPVATTTYAFNKGTTELVSAAQAAKPEVEYEPSYDEPVVNQDDINELQERLEAIAKSYQHDIYKSVHPKG